MKKHLISWAKEFDAFEIYRSMPGIGELTASQLIAELGDLNRFENSKQLNAYVGIDIRRYQSGTFTGQVHINKRGNSKARKLLFIIVRNMLFKKITVRIISWIITTN